MTFYTKDMLRLSTKLPRLTFPRQGFQQWLSWSLIGTTIVLLVSNFAGQTGLLATLAIVALGLLTAGFLWQQRQIRLLQRQLLSMQQQYKHLQPRRAARPVPASAIQHYESDHLFHQGQTKH